MAIITYENWKAEDKLAAAVCYMRYPKLADYLEAVEYTGQYVEEGKQAYKKAKKIYISLSKVFTDEEIKSLLN
jgi:hypothetical protein